MLNERNETFDILREITIPMPSMEYENDTGVKPWRY